MEMIRLELVKLDESHEPEPDENEVYVNEAFLCMVSKDVKNTSAVHKRIHYVAYLADGQSFFITEECYNSIIGKIIELPPVPDVVSRCARPERPEINIGELFKLW